MRFEEATTLHNMWRVDVHDCEPSVTKEECDIASRLIDCLPGRTVVACHRPRTKVGVLHLREDMQDKFRADLATVRSSNAGLEPGQEVVTDWQLGKRIQGLDIEGLSIDAEIRFYGIVGGTAKDGDDGCEDIKCQGTDEGILMIKEGEDFRPLGDKVLLKLPPMNDSTEGGIILADSVKKRSAKWEIVAVGPSAVPEARPGRKAICHTGGMHYVVTDEGVEYAVGSSTGKDAPVYAIVS